MATHSVNKDGTIRSRLDQLPRVAAIAGWPTPVANDDNKSVKAHLAMKQRMGGNRTAITSLQVMAKTAGWPTPIANDAEKRGQPSPGNGLAGDVHLAHGPIQTGSPAKTGKPGQLNPDLARWLMGYPAGWYSSKDTETP